MKKPIMTLLGVAALLLSPYNLGAQGLLSNFGVRPYGSVRAYSIFDTRDAKTGADDLLYYVPMDVSLNLEGQDIYSNPSFKMRAISSRIGFDVTQKQYGPLTAGGKIEADFYLLNGSSASARLRQAYADLVFDKLGYVENKFSIRLGQAWHPMAADLPYLVLEESGSPFNPYTFSPQVMLDFRVYNGLRFTAGALYPVQNPPVGPLGPSENYVKYGVVPELYAGVSFESKHFLARAGADFINLRPRWRTTTYNYETEPLYDAGSRTSDRISMVSPFVYLQYENDFFKVNAKSVFASGGDHLQLLGGYALYDWSDPKRYEYTPLRSSVSYLSFSVGRKLQLMCMGGYIMQLGTKHNLPVNDNGYCLPTTIYFFSGGTRHISQVLRFSPTLSYHIGGLTLALEYDNTNVQYGSVLELDNYARAKTSLHWVTAHRAMGIIKLDF